MCEIFISTDPQRYESRTRAVRLHGVSTSIRLENLFWDILDEIAERDGMSVGQLVTRLHDELSEAELATGNFASFLRVCAARYLSLQLCGQIPADRSVPIRSLNAKRVLAAERSWLAGRVTRIAETA